MVFLKSLKAPITSETPETRWINVTCDHLLSQVMKNVSFNFFFDCCNFSSAKLWKWQHIHFFFSLFFTPFSIDEGFDSSNFHNFTFSSPQVWEYENVTCNVFYLAKLIIPKRKRRILFCNNHYFDQQKSVLVIFWK